MPLSNYTRQGTIDFWYRNATVTRPTTVYVALYSTNPTGANTGTEISGGGYQRQAVTFGASSISGEQAISQNTAVVNFPQLNANVGNAAYIALMSAVNGGNLLAYAPLPVSLQLNAGFQPYIAVGDLRVIAQ
jgi:hypothetical protein